MKSIHTDYELVERLQEGNMEAFDLFYEKYSVKLILYFSLNPLQIYGKKQTFRGIVLSFSEKNPVNYAYCCNSYDPRNSASTR